MGEIKGRVEHPDHLPAGTMTDNAVTVKHLVCRLTLYNHPSWKYPTPLELNFPPQRAPIEADPCSNER